MFSIFGICPSENPTTAVLSEMRINRIAKETDRSRPENITYDCRKILRTILNESGKDGFENADECRFIRIDRKLVSVVDPAELSGFAIESRNFFACEF